MKDLFSVSKTAELVGVTAETLRYYDRIGLVHPHTVDKWTGYRYYSQREIVILGTIKALRAMDLPLEKVREILALNDISAIVQFLQEAEERAQIKIAELEQAKERISRAKNYYIAKSRERVHGGHSVEELPQRAVMFCDAITEPSVDVLWNYHRHFIAALKEGDAERYSFEDIAGVYRDGSRSAMFAVLKDYPEGAEVSVLPAGRYLCADCTEKEREQTTSDLIAEARTMCGHEPLFCVQIVMLKGILMWDYRIQVPLM